MTTHAAAFDTQRTLVCVQGLGHVGSAMAVAVAGARDEQDQPAFNVVGLDLDDEEGRRKVGALNAGRFPVACDDAALAAGAAAARAAGNLVATSDPACLGAAQIVVVDVPYEVADLDTEPRLAPAGFEAAVRTVARHAAPGALVLIETTVPPGTCERVVTPILEHELTSRGLPREALLLAHSYERVMPGDRYLESIVRFWRVYAGGTPEAADAAEDFLSRVIDVKHFPLTRLAGTTASETAKLLENSYRATNIAFIDEWSRFAEAAGVDLFEIIEAIRVRPTHRDIRTPGFGVGGYCLTKDPLLAVLGARETLGLKGLEFPFSVRAVETNRRMPEATLRMVEEALGDLAGKRLLLLGVSYLPGVADTRYSPAETFVTRARAAGAQVQAHDPLVTHWRELDWRLPEALPSPADFDAVVLAVPHAPYRALDLAEWLGSARPVLVDAHGVLTAAQRRQAASLGLRLRSIGRGETRP